MFQAVPPLERQGCYFLLGLIEGRRMSRGRHFLREEQNVEEKWLQ